MPDQRLCNSHVLFWVLIALLAGLSAIRSMLYVAVALAVSLTIAGFAAASYRNERTTLGARHFQSGEWSLTHGDLEGAIDQLRKALLFSPDDEKYRLALAYSLVRVNHLDEAEAHLEQLAQEDPGNGRINALLAQIAIRRGKNKLAIERYQRAVYEYWPADMIPQRRAARWELVYLLERSNRTSEAVGELIQLSSSATDPKERTRIAYDLLRYDALSQSERIFREVAAALPSDPAPRRGIGIIDFNRGEYVGARHELQAALRLDPKDAESQYWLGLSNQVIELDPLLPNIGSQERSRRSQNLLRSVVEALGKCKPALASNDEATSEMNNAGQLLSAKRNIDGLADGMQQSAARLWQDRHLFCSSGLGNQEKAIDTAIARVTGE